jgi:hypothetical protein
MKITDGHGLTVIMAGERSSIGSAGEQIRLYTAKSAQAAIREFGEKGQFAGDTEIRLVGQTATLPGDLYDNLATLDPRWRPFILDFTRQIAMQERVYMPIYDTQESADFDETMKIVDFTDATDFGYTEWQDGEGVWMNDISGGESSSVTLKIHAGGYARTMRDEMFNRLWKQQLMAKKQAEGYNKFLNHLHLYPIVAHDYTGKTINIDSLNVADTPTWWEKNWRIMKLMKDKYYSAKDSHLQPLRRPVLLMNTYTYQTAWSDSLDEIRFADSKRYTTMQGWWDSVVLYDDALMNFSGRKVTWAGPANGEVFVISPKDGFKELIKQPLTMIADAGRAANLSAEEKVWWDCRGIICDPTTFAFKMELIPASDTTDGLAKA